MGAMTGNEAEIQWYLARDGQQYGPITDTEMKILVDAGHLRPGDLVWRAGFAEWKRGADVFPRPSPPAPAIPPAAQPAPTQASPTQPVANRAEPRRAEPGLAEPGRQMQPRAAATTPTTSRAVATAGGAAGGGLSGGTSSQQPQPRSAAAPAPGQPAATANTATSAPSATAKSPTTATGPATSSAAPSPAKPGANRASLVRKAAIAAGIVAVFGTAGVVAGKNKDTLMRMAGIAGDPHTQIPVIKAVPSTRTPPEETAALQETAPPAAPTAEAAPQQPAAPPQTSPAAPPEVKPAETLPDQSQPAAAATSEPPAITRHVEALDGRLGKSPLWSYLKTSAPDWYRTRVAEAAQLVADGKPELDATRHMVEGVVALRRQSADQALSAPAPRLKAIASAFLENLQALAGVSATTCYSFISQGESSPPVIELLHASQGGTALEVQAVAILQAASEGKTSPTTHERPQKEDYDLLAGQLGKLGWSQADLQMFADPKALSRAEPARVCQMVRDWFRAHIAIKDEKVQERLLFETLRPVVAG